MIDRPDPNAAQGRKQSGLNVARLLSLAAAPTFAIMATLTVVHGDGMPEMLCSAARDGSPLTGMTAMYALMSAFHLAPWLRLLASRRWGAQMAAVVTQK
jgi:hypothetical protein